MTEAPRTPEDICMRFHVAGVVQGVFFRASAREQALRLGLNGYVRNLPDGRVEVLACGSREALDRLHAWLRVGPPEARVSGVSSETAPAHYYSGFSVS